MKLQIKIVVENLEEREILHQYYTNKQRANHLTDSGFDLICPRRVEVKPFKTTKVPLGISCQIVEQNSQNEVLSGGSSTPFSPHGYFIYPRSSIIKTPMRLANSVGIIDYMYRGEITAVVDYYRNEPPYTYDPNDGYGTSEGFVIEAGTRYFQLCAPDLRPIQIELVDELTETARGNGGFGSTN
jgi:dUTP pyrophosphatase